MPNFYDIHMGSLELIYYERLKAMIVFLYAVECRFEKPFVKGEAVDFSFIGSLIAHMGLII
jgi:hypothetical protein